MEYDDHVESQLLPLTSLAHWIYALLSCSVTLALLKIARCSFGTPPLAQLLSMAMDSKAFFVQRISELG
jgi:hypothetical protein